MKALLIILALTPATGVFAGDWNLAELARQFAGVSQSRSAFVEHTSSALLNENLVTRGMLFYQAPDRLTKQINEPEKATWFIFGEEVILERPGKQQKRFSIDAHPALRPLATSIRSLLAGQVEALENFYNTRLSGTETDWKLVLTPREDALKAFIQSITIQGVKNHLKRVVTLNTNGDQTDMQVMDSADPNPQ
ncbi:MAG: hypothetical protein DSZ32_01640 [Gammaproteobacteria bacterium]|nr:MAG: hypothetical protein DSZ32_01640 [Gammaproteobacteria bacterium]RTZ61766.1 MAG: hypothetical protein DSZ33_00435 [Gammaproteobacteria bacterium]